MGEQHERPGVVVLYNMDEKVGRGDARDIIATQGVIACAEAVMAALRGLGWRVAGAPYRSDAETALAPYSSLDWVVFNLGEGLEGRLFEEARIAWAVEAMGYRFTGNDGMALALTTHKARTKRVLQAAGVATPAGWLFRQPEEIGDDYPFPLIVKPTAEDASQGIGSDAVARTPEELRQRVRHIMTDYRQAALAEQFIVGREFNAGIWGDPPELLPLAEIDFSAFGDRYQQFVSYAAKWEEDSFEYRHTPVTCPAVVEPALAARIRDTAARCWTAVGCRGYARVDMRVSDEGVPYVIEVNANPDISPDAGFFRAASRVGYSFEAMVARMLELAL